MKRTLVIAGAAVLAWASLAAARAADANEGAVKDLTGGVRRPAPAGAATQASRPAATSTPATQPASRPAVEPSPGVLATIGTAVAKLYLYFGPVGVLSVLAWLAVWAVMAVWAVRTKGMAVCLGASLLVAVVVVYVLTMPRVGQIVGFFVWLAIFAALAVAALWSFLKREVPVAFTALILAMVAFGLGMWNSDNVVEIEEDRTAEIAAARARQMAARQVELAKLKSKAADIHFAEDDANDTKDIAGYKEKEAAKLAGADPNAPHEYAYRKRGRKQRDPNKVAAPNGELLTSVVGGQAERTRSFAGGAVMLVGDDWVRANQLDRLNRFAVRLTLVVALLMAGIEYLRRFNHTFGSILPMPIACRAIDSLWPKTHAVYLHAPDAAALRDYLETAVQKGESFLCFTASDPWPGRDTRLARLPVKGLWPLRKIACRPGDGTCAGRFVFESAWYGRYCFVLLAESLDEPTSALLDELLDLMRMRKHTRATAARTVNIVWDIPAPLPAETLGELASLCRETNLKLLVRSADPPADGQAAELFEEVCACQSATESR